MIATVSKFLYLLLSAVYETGLNWLPTIKARPERPYIHEEAVLHANGVEDTKLVVSIIHIDNVGLPIAVNHTLDDDIRWPQLLPGATGYSFLSHPSDPAIGDRRLIKLINKSAASLEKLCRLLGTKVKNTASDRERDFQIIPTDNSVVVTVGESVFTSRPELLDEKKDSDMTELYTKIQFQFANGVISTQHFNSHCSTIKPALLHGPSRAQVKRIDINSGLCLFSKAVLCTSPGHGQSSARNSNPAVPTLPRNADLTMYELDIIVRLSSAISDVAALAKNKDTSCDSSISINIDIPGFEYYWAACELLERGLVSSSYVQSWIVVIDKRRRQLGNVITSVILSMLEDNGVHSISINITSGTEPAAELVKAKVAIGIVPSLAEIMSALGSHGDDARVWREFLAHLDERQHPSTMGDLSRLLYLFKSVKPALLYQTTATANGNIQDAVGQRLIIQIDDINEWRIFDRARTFLKGYSKKLPANAEKSIIVGLFPAQRVFAAGSGRSDLYLKDPGSKLCLDSEKEVISPLDIIGVTYGLLKSHGNQKNRRPILSFFSKLIDRKETQIPDNVEIIKATKAIKVVDDVKGAYGLNLLHSPPNPLIDLIFVHGLGGGSRKSWSKSPAHFWPQEWIPNDTAFENVRVHSFGYDSDRIITRKTTLDIRDFAKALLWDLAVSPYIRDTSNPTRIVFIGHSMGGLVIKKAYLLAKLDPVHRHLVSRFHSIYFIGTPHKGSDLAKTLENILSIYTPPEYVTALKHGSGTITAINDEFGRCCDDLELWSFYETARLSPLGSLVVDKDSATLGYTNEKSRPLNGDHRSICKFDSPEDPNYRVLREALAYTVDRILTSGPKVGKTPRNSQINSLKKYLGVAVEPEEDLFTIQDTCMPGTCQWLSEKKRYMQWKEFTSDTPSILWLNGNPSAGKSYLAGYTISQLQSARENCSFFFFKYVDKSKSTLGACLRSLALQMAYKYTEIGDMFLKMQEDGINLDNYSERMIWRKLFLSGILQAKLRNHYWIIDGLDECYDYAAFFDGILNRIDQSVLPLRIMITSRDTSDLGKQFAGLGSDRFWSAKISITDTLADITCIIEANVKSFTTLGDRRTSLVEALLEKSNGSFLWITLVLKELAGAQSENEIYQILKEVPRGMESLYQRTLEMMSKASRGKELACAILCWATCAQRPLRIKELEGALRLDINDSFFNLEESIAARCGQLVTIDKSGKLEMIHETAREFLVNKYLKSEFAVSETEAHRRIARACLLYLTGEEMNPPRVPGRQRIPERADFSTYASTAFSYHLTRADPLDDGVFGLLNGFLTSNILSWIEIFAHAKDLTPVIRTAAALDAYLDARTAQKAGFDPAMERVRSWATDLDRMTKRFSEYLLQSPSAIYSQIPQFCPKETSIHKATIYEHGFSVLGPSASQWDNQLASIRIGSTVSYVIAFCHGREFLAVGCRAGVTVYDASSFAEYKTLKDSSLGESRTLIQSNDEDEEEEPELERQGAVRTGSFLQFKTDTNILVWCSRKIINIYDVISGQATRIRANVRTVLEYSIYGDLLIIAGACREGRLATWSWDLSRHDYQIAKEGVKGPPGKKPARISISKAGHLLAVTYRGSPGVEIWHLQRNKLISSFTEEHIPEVTSISSLTFGSEKALAIFHEYRKVLCLNPLNGKIIGRLKGYFTQLAASADGQRLALVEEGVDIYDFQTLAFICHLDIVTDSRLPIAFDDSGSRIAGLTLHSVDIWRIPLPTQGTPVNPGLRESTIPGRNITALAVDLEGEYVFCSKEDEAVYLFDLATGAEVRTLYRHHPDLYVKSVQFWPERSCIISCATTDSFDGRDELLIWSLDKSEDRTWIPVQEIYRADSDSHAGGFNAEQILPCGKHPRFIILTSHSSSLWSLDGQKVEIHIPGPALGRWIQHPLSPQHVICLMDFTPMDARIYTWSDFSSPLVLTAKDKIKYYLSDFKLQQFPDVADRQVVAFNPRHSSNEVITASDDKFKMAVSTAPWLKLILFGPTFENNIHSIRGISSANQLVFVDKHSWVCSIGLTNLSADSLSYRKHFIIPHQIHDPYIFSRFPNPYTFLISKQNVILLSHGNLVIVKGALQYGETVDVEVYIEKKK
ncbi:hypothetical protein FQN49_000060 [Arthroderma sp. PD_2]|nr:hypothetical protein FQN49_000060 [Arthroderma sp. PD_2]